MSVMAMVRIMVMLAMAMTRTVQILADLLLLQQEIRDLNLGSCSPTGGGSGHRPVLGHHLVA